MRVCRALNTHFSLGQEYNTFVQIIRPLEGELDDGDLSRFLDNFSFDEDNLNDREMIKAEEADQVRT